MSSFQSLFNESGITISLIIQVDDITIGYTSDGKLQVKDLGISTAKIANLAVTNAKINDMDASKLTGTITIPIDNTLIQTDTILVSFGSAGSPSIAFKLEPTTGIYRSNVGEISFSSLGVAIFKIHSFGGEITGSFIVSDYTEIGNYLTVHGNITIDNSGSLIVDTGNIVCGGDLNVDGTSLFADGNAISPSLTFSNDGNTGIYRNGAATLSITSLANEVARFNFTQNQMFVPLLLGSNYVSCSRLNLANFSNQISFGSVDPIILNVAPSAATRTYTVPNTSTNSTFIMSDTNQSIMGNLALNRSVDSTTALKVVLPTTPFVGSIIAAFGVPAGNQIEFYDSQTSLSRGAYINFANGFPASIRGNNRIEFWPNTSSSTFTVSSTNYTFGVANVRGVLSLDGVNNLVSTQLANGQFLIGRTGNTPIAANITGTSNQINVTNGSGTITLSTPQDIAAASSPGFNSLTLSNDLTLSARTASSAIYLDASKKIASSALTNGQMLIGSTSANPVAATLTGTSNQVIITNGAGSITLSTPQNINTSATPTFASETLTNTTNQLVLGTTNTATINTVAPAASRVYSIQDPLANANFVMSQGTQSLGGIYSFTGQPFRQRSASSYVSVSNTTVTALNIWDTDVINQGGITTNNAIFTVPVSGIYCVSVEVQYDVNTTGQRSCWIFKNGTDPPRYGSVTYNPPNDDLRIVTTTYLSLAANDYVACNVYQSSGANLHIGTLWIGATSIFTIYKIC